MAKIVKGVDRLIPSAERTQVFTDADAATGDIVDIFNSLGRHARKVRIETAGSSDLSIRRNVARNVYPLRIEGVFDGPLHGAPANLAQGQEIIDGTIAAEIIGPDAVELQGPLRDIEVTWSTGTWTLVVS